MHFPTKISAANIVDWSWGLSITLHWVRLCGFTATGRVQLLARKQSAITHHFMAWCARLELPYNPCFLPLCLITSDLFWFQVIQKHWFRTGDMCCMLFIQKQYWGKYRDKEWMPDANVKKKKDLVPPPLSLSMICVVSTLLKWKCKIICSWRYSYVQTFGLHWSNSLLQVISKWTEANPTSKWSNVKHDTFLTFLKQDYFLSVFFTVSKLFFF